MHVSNLPHWSFLDWLMHEGKSLRMTITPIPWRNRPPGFPNHITCAEFEHKDMHCFGLGHHLNRSLAYTIAAAEALERAAMYELGLQNSNGCAVHTDLVQAQRNALLELSERDAFLFHFSTGAGTCQSAEIEDSQLFQDFYQWCASSGLRLRPRVLNNILGKVTVMSCLDGYDETNPAAFFIGFGTSENTLDAFERSLPEVLRFYESWRATPERFSALAINDFLSITPKTIMEHVRLGQNADYAKIFNQRMFQSEPVFRPVIEDLANLTTYRTISLNSVWPNCPLVFTKATNPLMAEIFFGEKWQLSYTTPSASLPLIPHCLG